MTLDLIPFYQLGNNIKQTLINTAKTMRADELPEEFYTKINEKIWWKLRYILTDYNGIIKDLEAFTDAAPLPANDSN